VGHRRSRRGGDFQNGTVIFAPNMEGMEKTSRFKKKNSKSSFGVPVFR